MILILKCPFCKNSMKYGPKGSIAKKRKTCVYCGKSFSVVKNLKQG